ncbi:MAG TPA: hypothetical protein VGF55_19610 [Gemmataceae bacterium]|jgi:hypothetical protein
MKTLVTHLWWKTAVRAFRRRGPTAPIRRRRPAAKPLLELVRLDDRALPGSVLATAAAQALLLSGPVAWLNPAGSDLAAVGPAADAIPAAPPADGAPDAAADGPELSDRDRAFLSLTVPNIADGRDAGPATVTAGDSLRSESGGADLAEPGANDPAVFMPRSSSADRDPPAPASGTGGATGVAVPGLIGRIASDGAPLAGGSAPAAADPAGPARPTAAPTAHPTPTAAHAQPAATPTPPPTHAPAGHFAQRLQLLLHPGGTSDTLDLAGTRDQQAQLGAMVGGQLFGGLSVFGSGNSASHRGASLLGQALAAGSGDTLGLRQSPSSSGLFGLVGSHSLGDLLDGPANRGGLLAGAGSIAQAVPAGGALPGPTVTAPTAGPATTGTTLTVVSPLRRPAADSSDIPIPTLPPIPPPDDPGWNVSLTAGGGGMYGMSTDSGDSPSPDAANFILTVRGTDPSGKPFALQEIGTVNFTPNWDVNSPDDPLQVRYDCYLRYGDGDPGPDDRVDGVDWSGNATADGLLVGYDIDQANQDRFGFSRSDATSYVLDCWGNDSFTGTDTSTPTDEDGGTTTQHRYDNSLAGTDDFTLHVEGSGDALAVTWDDSVNSTFNNQDSGSDDHPATAGDPGAFHDDFRESDFGTHTETDHVEGTFAADGTFQVTSFDFDSTDDSSYQDYVGGTSSEPEPGGSETDSFAEGDNGYSHEHLHASGAPDDWAASLDDHIKANYADAEDGGESSSESVNGTTDTNSDTFHADDQGSHDDELHVAGTGNATTFTVTSASDRIEDDYGFHDSADGTAGESSTTNGESDSETDHYGETDAGHAHEVLTVSGGTDSLTATYTDTAHDGFTDSDAEHDTWNDPESHDSGHDDGTDGDSGSEDVQLSATAALDGWQSDDPDADPPDWQIINVTGDVTGSADLHAGDDGTDGEGVSGDSETEHFVDSSTGTEGFACHLSGSGTTFTLSQSSTHHLTTHSEDHTTDDWADLNTLDGEPATDAGSEEIDDIDDTTATVIVSQQSAIDVTGNTTVAGTQVETTAGGIAHLTDDGSDEVTAPDGHDRETWYYDAQVGQGTHSLEDTANGTTTIGIAQVLTGTITVGGTVDADDESEPGDTESEVGSATLTGTFGGTLDENGAVGDGQFQPDDVSGGVSLDITGFAQDQTVDVIDTTLPGGPDEFPVPVPMSGVTAFYYDGLTPGGMDYWSASGGDVGARLTITRTSALPSFHLAVGETDAAGELSLGNLDFDAQQVESFSFGGDYLGSLVNREGIPGDTATGSYTATDSVRTRELGSAAGLAGTQTDTLTFHEEYSGTQVDPEVPTESVTYGYTGDYAKTVATTAADGPGGADGGRVEELTVAASDSGYTLQSDYDGRGSYILYSGGHSQNYYQRAADLGDGVLVLTAADGMDTSEARTDSLSNGDAQIVETHTVHSMVLTRSLGANNAVEANLAEENHTWGVVTDVATGQQTPFDDDHPLPPQGFERSFTDQLLDVLSSPTATRLFGGLRLVAGLAEFNGGALLILSTPGTGYLGAFGGLGLMLVGYDDVQTGLTELWSGQPTESMRSRLVRELTGSPTAGMLADILAPSFFAGLGARATRGARAAAATIKANRVLSVRSGVQKQIRQVRDTIKKVLASHPGQDMAIDKGWNFEGEWLDHLRGLAAQGDRDAQAMVRGVERDLTPLRNRLAGLERQLGQMDAPPGPWEHP